MPAFNDNNDEEMTLPRSRPSQVPAPAFREPVRPTVAPRAPIMEATPITSAVKSPSKEMFQALDQHSIHHTPAPRIVRDTPPAAPKEVDMEVDLESLNVVMTVGDDVEIEGNIKLPSGSSIVVKGIVKGSIVCEGVVLIAKKACVRGQIRCGELWVDGEVSGLEDLQPGFIDAGIVTINVGAKIVADCIYDELSIASPNKGVKGNFSVRNLADNL